MSILFQRITVGNIEIKNRFVRSATHDFMGNPDGSVSEREIELYRELAKNEVGLIITAHAYVQHPQGRASVKQNAIYSDRFIEGYKRAAEAVHEYGSKIVAQITHAGRQIAPDYSDDEKPVAPSPVPYGTLKPRELSEEEIQQLIRDFIDAAARVKKSGCDGVQLHCAHGYLLSQFISPYTNRRRDKWGGAIENRTRILREIITGIQKELGSSYPILVKLNSTDGFSSPGYLTPDDVVFTARLLEELGAAALEISGGINEAKDSTIRPGIKKREQEAYFLSAARLVKEKVNIPVILVGGLRTLELMEYLVGSDQIDMAALSRPFIKEPDLVARFKNGQEKASCISCNGCRDNSGIRCCLSRSVP